MARRRRLRHLRSHDLKIHGGGELLRWIAEEKSTGRRTQRENGAERSGGSGNDALPHRLDAARKRGRQNISGVIQRRENLQKSVDERPPRALSIRRGGAGLPHDCRRSTPAEAVTMA